MLDENARLVDRAPVVPWLLSCLYLFVRGIHCENPLFIFFVCRLPNVIEGCDLWGLFLVRFHDGWVVYYLWSLKSAVWRRIFRQDGWKIFCIPDRSDQTYWPFNDGEMCLSSNLKICQLVSVFKDLYEMTYSLFRLSGEMCVGMLSREFFFGLAARCVFCFGPNADYFFGL